MSEEDDNQLRKRFGFNVEGTRTGRTPSRIPQTYVQTEGGVTSLAQMIKTCADEDNEEHLSPWDMDFIADMKATLNERQGAVNWLSKGQITQIERIYRKCKGD